MFDSEREFEEHFYSLDDADEQIAELAKWRKHQIRIVSKFIDQIKLVASEQYTTLDHFLLELLQNADDNEYDAGVLPSVSLELDEETFLLRNNERGFTAENLFAITYAAATTKLRKKTANTFIGEKGIGFKSVFAVAEYVDIHSPPYHFQLRNDEFIVPHPVPKETSEGTTIRLRLKRMDPPVHETLSRRLKALAESAQEFTIFLQKIEKLRVYDRISRKQSDVTIERDRENQYCIVSTNGMIREYKLFNYTKTLPPDVVSTRFADLNEPLEREIIFAVPLPDKAAPPVKSDGKLFCFLPTLITTATPVHIQIDAKTTTSRENILPFANSPWNRAIFDNLSESLADMLERMTEIGDFQKRLPEYLPWEVESKDLKNEEFKNLVFRATTLLKQRNIVLDRHGNFWAPHFVKRLPEVFETLLCEDKYEQAMSMYYFGSEKNTTTDYKPEEYFTFVDSSWARAYKRQLAFLGVQEIDTTALLKCLEKGAPDSVDLNKDSSVRGFLGTIMPFVESVDREYVWWNGYRRAVDVLRSFPIFPLSDGRRRYWGKLTHDVMWMRSDSPEAKGAPGATIVDPEFTYSPGGGGSRTEKGEETKEFNTRFRMFLERIGVKSYRLSEHLRKTVIRELTGSNTDISNGNERSRVTGLWLQLYRQIWVRRKTIVAEEGGDEYLKTLLGEIGRCNIPTRQAGTKQWMGVALSLAFLGKRFNTEDNLEHIYRGTAAPVIELDLLESLAAKSRAIKQRKVDWDDWYKFLVSCGARLGPFLVDHFLNDDNRYRYSSSTGYTDDGDGFAQAIRTAIEGHLEYRLESAKPFWLCKESRTVDLDGFTKQILASDHLSDFAARKISILFLRAQQLRTDLKFRWGMKREPRSVSTGDTLFLQQLRRGLWLKTNRGLRHSHDCFADVEGLRDVLRELVPFVVLGEKGYEEGFLRETGVKFHVDSHILQDLIEKWFETTADDNRSAESFEPYIRATLALARRAPSEAETLQSTLRLYSSSEDELIPLQKWLDESSEEYPPELVSGLRASFQRKEADDLESIIARVLGNKPLEERLESFLQALRDIGRWSGADEEIRKGFATQLGLQGLGVFGRIIYSTDQLPLLWDALPPMKFDDGVIPIASDFMGDDFVSRGAALLGLTTFSSSLTKVRYIERKTPLGKDLCNKTVNIVHHLLQSASRRDKTGIFNSVETMRKRVLAVEEIVYDNSDEKQYGQLNLPYCYKDGELVITRRESFERILPEFIDWTLGTTFKPLFNYVWNDPRFATATGEERDREKEAPGKEKEVDSERDKNGGHEGGGSSTSSGAAGNDEEGDQDKDAEDKDLNRLPTRRRRMVSQTLLSGSTGQSISTEAKTRRKEIEDKGRERLYSHLKTSGIQYRSVESEDRGYDFVIEVDGDEFYVELKASESRWDGWEEVLTPNEFQCARRMKERYLLCVIDQVLSDTDFNVYFIQDPVGQIDGFLFDSPWREIAVSLESLTREAPPHKTQR